MIRKLQNLFIFTITVLFSISCSEKEVEVDISPDMLISVRTNFLEVKIKDGTVDKEKIEKAVLEKLKSKICLFDGNAYEMKLGLEHISDLYESLGDYYAGKLKIAGTYEFDVTEPYVTFTFEEEVKRYEITGSFGSSFYNHFVRQEGGGEHHIAEKNKVFSLIADYKEEFEAEFPELESAYIKTDMMTARALETVKIK